jgi:arabinan endo-1,5-alpha-L-arabinosidase
MLTAALAIHFFATTLHKRDAYAQTDASMQRSDDNYSIFPGDGSFAVGSEHSHDPAVIELDGKLFALCTGNGGSMKSSTDFNIWKNEGPIIQTFPEWLRKAVPEHKSIWAPAAVKIGDTVRIYYCASRFFGGNDSVIGFMENKHFNAAKPHDGWTDGGKVIESSKANKDHWNCIDPDVQVDQMGRHWLFFGSYYSGIYEVELDPISGKIKEGSTPVSVANNKATRENALEGACGAYRDGYYYLFVSYGLAAQGVRSTYQMMVGRSKNPNGPFLDAKGTSMEEGGHVNILKTSPPMFSPGHNEVMKYHDGRWLTSYHYYDGRKYWTDGKWGLPRLQVREILWSNDGWPLPGLPVEFTNEKRFTDHKSLAGKWIHQADFADAEEITLAPDGAIIAGKRKGKWEVKGETLTMKWPKIEDEKDFWVDQLQIAYKGNYYVGRNQSGMVIRGIRNELK